MLEHWATEYPLDYQTELIYVLLGNRQIQEELSFWVVRFNSNSCEDLQE